MKLILNIMHEKGSFYSDVNRLDGIIIQKIKGKEHLPVADDLVVETSAFKKWEENKLAAPFLNFIVYTSEEKVYSKTRYLRS